MCLVLTYIQKGQNLDCKIMTTILPILMLLEYDFLSNVNQDMAITKGKTYTKDSIWVVCEEVRNH